MSWDSGSYTITHSVIGDELGAVMSLTIKKNRYEIGILFTLYIKINFHYIKQSQDLKYRVRFGNITDILHTNFYHGLKANGVEVFESIPNLKSLCSVWRYI